MRIDPKVVDVLVAGRAHEENDPLAELTDRELEVLGHIAHGASNAAIAEILVLTKRAVEKHINAIFLKLGLTWEKAVHKRVKAVILYLAEDGVPAELSFRRLDEVVGERLIADRRLPLLDFKDLRTVLNHLTGDGADALKEYGGISKASVGVLLREWGRAGGVRPPPPVGVGAPPTQQDTRSRGGRRGEWGRAAGPGKSSWSHRAPPAERGGPGVGAVGMCLTGGFALAMMVDGSVVALNLAERPPLASLR